MEYLGLLRKPVNENQSSRGNTTDPCVSDSCDNKTLVYVSRLCSDVSLKLSTSFSLFTIIMRDSLFCATLSAYELNSDVFSEPVVRSVSISVVPSQEDRRDSPQAVVQNQRGVIVGQLLSDMMVLSIEFPDISHEQLLDKNSTIQIEVQMCFLLESTTQADSRYTVYDVGTNTTENIIQPLGLDLAGETGDMICFETAKLNSTDSGFILIKRVNSYESEVVITSAGQAIIFTTAALYLLGCLIVLLVMIVNIIFLLKLPRRAIILWGQSITLMLIRGVYFLLIGLDVGIVVGSLADFILIEAPTFFYVGIFFQILIPLGSFNYYQKKQVEIPKWKVRGAMILCWLIVWLAFAAIVIGLSQIDTTPTSDRECACRISTISEIGDAALYLRVGYKSVVLLIETLYYQKRALFLEIFGIAICLFLNSIAFVIYYSLNNATPYFIIVLWLTELFPISLLSLIIGMPGIQYVVLRISSSNFLSTHTTRDAQ
jgi:hypothetical protein